MAQAPNIDFYLARIVAVFMRAHPKVRVDIEWTDRVVNLIEGRIDLALRVRDSGLEDSGLVARRSAQIPWPPCCLWR